MARSARKTPAKDRPTTNQKLAIHDNSSLPKLKKDTSQTVTLQEALAESGESMEDLKAPEPGDSPLVKELSTSNLAVTIRQHRHKYVTTIGRNDKKTQSCNDYVAKTLLRIPFEELMRFVYLRVADGKYDALNAGHQRMCAGNLVRAWWKKGDEDTLSWLAAHQPDDVEETEEAEESGEE